MVALLIELKPPASQTAAASSTVPHPAIGAKAAGIDAIGCSAIVDVMLTIRPEPNCNIQDAAF
jgi:hypothetical protein